MTNKLIALMLVVSSVAFAQKSEPMKQQPKPQEITFDPSEIDGKNVGPTGSYTIVKPRVDGFQLLIKVRTDFNDKLRNSVYEM